MILNEPVDGIGFSYENGRFVNIDILRYQRVVNTLYRRGILSDLSSPEPQQRNSILEIGGGYGGLAHHLSNILGNVVYVIVDLPETLLFSAAYLSLHNPDKKVYVYNKDDFSEFIDAGGAGSYDFILMPNYMLESLTPWRFKIAINMISFQEMNAQQVNEYLDFIRDNSVGQLYSWNIDSHVLDTDLPTMASLLEGRFEYEEMGEPEKPESRRRRLIDGLKSIASTLGITNPPPRGISLRHYIYRGHEYLCRPIQTRNPD